MIATTINQKASVVARYLLVAAVSSLATSWALKTPELHRQSETLHVVETKTLPAVTKQLAQTKTQLAQTQCDKAKAVRVAVQGILADQKSDVDAPDWSDLKACPKVVPAKPIPISALVPKIVTTD